MTTEQARNIPMTDLLARLGHQPLEVRKGYEYWYLSPFRAERSPSFKVNMQMNCWKDFGLAGMYHKPDKGGGNVLDFVMHYNSTNSVKDALAYLREMKIPVKDSVQIGRANTGTRQEGSNPIRLLEVKNLANPKLEKYILGRGIDLDLARMYLRECYYRVESRGKDTKPWFGVGMETDSRSYEIRSQYFKAVVGGRKDATTLRQTEAPHLFVFEGFMDHLSLLTMKRKQSLNGTTMILHSANMVKKAAWYAKNFDSKKIVTCLDNDMAGEAAFQKLKTELPGYELLRGNKLYKGHKDLNDCLVAMRCRDAGNRMKMTPGI